MRAFAGESSGRQAVHCGSNESHENDCQQNDQLRALITFPVIIHKLLHTLVIAGYKEEDCDAHRPYHIYINAVGRISTGTGENL